MTTRRDFLRTTALSATLASGLSQPAQAAETSTNAPMAARQRLTARHRNVFNADTCIYFYKIGRAHV